MGKNLPEADGNRLRNALAKYKRILVCVTEHLSLIHIYTEEAQALAAKLRRSAVTVLNNYFDVLPLAPVEGDIAVVSIGEKEADAAFVEAMKKNAGISHFHLPWNADEALWQEVHALLFGHFGVIIPKELGNFGLVLFIFTIGIQAGPGFFDSFRRCV